MLFDLLTGRSSKLLSVILMAFEDEFSLSILFFVIFVCFKSDSDK